ncbi:MAG: AMP-binding protein [Myxococcota bacterium]
MIDRDRTNWGTLLQNATDRYPNRPAVKSAEGKLTYAEFNARANRVAYWLKSLGVKKGDVINLMVENRPELLYIYSGIAKLGAINAMIDTRITGEELRTQLDMHSAAVAIVGTECWSSFRAAQAKAPKTTVAWVGACAAAASKDDSSSCPEDADDLLTALESCSEHNPSENRYVEPNDVLAYVFTSSPADGSGRTAEKMRAARVTHKKVATSAFYNGHVVLGMQTTDTLYAPLPLFDTNALILSWPACLVRGASIAVRRQFSAPDFLFDVRQFHATVFCYSASFAPELLRVREAADDSDSPLTRLIGSGMRNDAWKPFKRRYGVSHVFEALGHAESSLYFINLLNLDNTIGFSAAPYAIVQADLEQGTPVRDTEGRLKAITDERPGLLLGQITEQTPLVGYSTASDNERRVLRDVFEPGDAWFNTNDVVQRKGLGHLIFVDRLLEREPWDGEDVVTDSAKEKRAEMTESSAEQDEMAVRSDEVAANETNGVHRHLSS